MSQLEQPGHITDTPGATSPTWHVTREALGSAPRGDCRPGEALTARSCGPHPPRSLRLAGRAQASAPLRRAISQALRGGGGTPSSHSPGSLGGALGGTSTAGPSPHPWPGSRCVPLAGELSLGEAQPLTSWQLRVPEGVPVLPTLPRGTGLREAEPPVQGHASSQNQHQDQSQCVSRPGPPRTQAAGDVGSKGRRGTQPPPSPQGACLCTSEPAQEGMLSGQ